MRRREFITLLGGALSVFHCVSASAQEGYYGAGHDKWHQGFYSTLKRNDGQGSCCNLMDCRPTQSRMVGDHYEVKVDGEWMRVPSDKINNVVAPDGGAHVCAPRQAGPPTKAFYSASSSRQRAEIFREVIRADSEVMPMKLPRRRQFLHLAAGAAALPAVSRIARAQAYPTRPVRFIVGFPAGGPTDIVARLMGNGCQSGSASNSSSTTGQGLAAISPPRRSCSARRTATRCSWSATTNAINATLYDKLNFNFIRDIAPVAGITREPHVMVVNPSVPAKTVPEFIAYAKANPGKINMASAGNGTAPHVAGELFKMMTGIDMVHVPYRGAGTHAHRSARRAGAGLCSAPCLVDRVHQGRQAARAGGDHRDALGGAARHPDRGRIRAGLRGERVVRHRRAQEYARRNHRQAQQGDQCGPRRSQMKARLADLGGTVLAGSPADFGKLIADETEKWAKVIKFGTKPD